MLVITGICNLDLCDRDLVLGRPPLIPLVAREVIDDNDSDMSEDVTDSITELKLDCCCCFCCFGDDGADGVDADADVDSDADAVTDTDELLIDDFNFFPPLRLLLVLFAFEFFLKYL